MKIHLSVGSLLGCVCSLLPFITCLYSDGDEQYGVMLDAGSSGTKLKVYRWLAPTVVTEIPSLDLMNSSKKFRPGIAQKEGDLTEYLRDIIIKAEESVPIGKRNSTPIFLMATAGARILESRLALGLLNRIRNVLSNKTVNPFRFSGKNVRILSGEEEGVFAWIALNALNNFFNTSRPASHPLGLLEMGGGSTQVAFVPSVPLYAGEFQVYLGGRRYDLYVHSYLFYGSNYIKQRVYNYLADNNPDSKIVHNPCRLTGDDINVTVSNRHKVTFLGDSDPDGCSDILRALVAKAEGDRCYPKPCAIGSVYQPSVGNTSFYATQGYVYTPQTMRSLDHSKHLNVTKLQEEAHTYCSKDKSAALSEYDVQVKYVSDECLMGLYIPLLLLEAYRIEPELNSVTVSNKAQDKRIDWTMGAMIYEISMHFQSERMFPITKSVCDNDTHSYQLRKPTPAEPVPVAVTGRSTRTSHDVVLQTIATFVVIYLLTGNR